MPRRYLNGRNVKRRRTQQCAAAAETGPQRPPKFTIGLMHELCEYCGALRFRRETRNCCHNGKVQLPPLSPYPEELNNLLCSGDEQSKNFQDNIRQYNSALSFASFGAQVVYPPGRGPYTFRLHGQIYHRTGSLHPGESEKPIYNQLYIIEGHQATEHRLRYPENHNCRRDTMNLLTDVIQRNSPFAMAYEHMFEVEKAAVESVIQNNSDPPNITMYFKQGRDQCRCNAPTHDEVAAVFVVDDGAPPVNRDIVVHPRNQPPRKISYMSANIDPMVYSVFFPRGDLGWQHNTPHNPLHSTPKRNTLILLQFYAHRLACRAQFNPLFYGGKLFQQYVVDAYVRTEAAHLDFVRRNQNNLSGFVSRTDRSHTNAV